MMAGRTPYWLIPALSLLLNGCGATVPKIQEFYDSEQTGPLVDAIVTQVQCEVGKGVQSIVLDDIDIAKEETARLKKPVERVIPWLDTWLANITLTLTIDEKSSLNPGVSLISPIQSVASTFANKTTLTTPQSFSLGIGASASTEATRKETLSWLMDFKDYTTPKQLVAAESARNKHEDVNKSDKEKAFSTGCSPGGGIFIQSDLALKEWLYASLLPAFRNNHNDESFSDSLKAESKAIKKDVISHEITFILAYSGNVTPTWKLVRVATNQGTLPLFGAQRTRTQDLQITMGPAQNGGPSQTALNTDLANKIALALRSP